MDSVKVSRDDKIREVNVAYKILKEGKEGWSHSVVSRPVRELVKLYEIGDTTFAEDMANVYKASRDILAKRGAVIGDNKHSVPSTSSCYQQSSSHDPFLSCMDAVSWCKQGDEATELFWNEFDTSNLEENDNYYDLNDEMIFLI